MKKYLSIALSAALAVSLFPANAMAGTVTDIQGHWAHDTIVYAIGDGLVAGYPDDTFRPDNSITRAEFVTILNTGFGIADTETPSKEFSDLDQSAWYAGKLNSAVANEYLNGYSDGTINPNGEITREEAAAVIYNLFGGDPEPSYAESFTDSNEMTWSKDAVGAVVRYGVFSGYEDGSFKPKNAITRAEAVVAVKKAMGFDPTQLSSIKKNKTSEPTETIKTSNNLEIKENYSPNSVETIDGDVTVSAKDLKVSNLDIKGNLIISEDVGEGNVTFNNVTVKGTIMVKGGGSSSIHFIDSSCAVLEVYKKNVNITFEKNTNIPSVVMFASAKLNTENLKSTKKIDVKTSDKLQAYSEINLIGDFKNIEVSVPNITLLFSKGTVQSVLFDSEAKGGKVTLTADSTLKRFETDSAVDVNNTKGTIEKAVINSSNVSMKKKAESMEGKNPEITGSTSSSGGGGGGGSSSSSGSDSKPSNKNIQFVNNSAILTKSVTNSNNTVTNYVYGNLSGEKFNANTGDISFIINKGKDFPKDVSENFKIDVSGNIDTNANNMTEDRKTVKFGDTVSINLKNVNTSENVKLYIEMFDESNFVAGFQPEVKLYVPKAASNNLASVPNSIILPEGTAQENIIELAKQQIESKINKSAVKVSFEEISGGLKVTLTNIRDLADTASKNVTVSVKSLESISINTVPNKKVYKIGEAFDITGLKVLKRYTDGTGITEIITDINTITGFDSTTAGEKTITVTIEGKTATFKVTVSENTPEIVLNSIFVKTNPSKTTYQIGEALDITGLEVVGKYNDNSEKVLNITSSNITGFDSTTAGEKTITVTYEGKTAVFKVTVKEADPQVVLNSIFVKTNLSKTTYQIGEALDITGLEVVGKYNDNSEKVLNITSSNITGFDSTTAGEKTITVTYEGKTTTFKVMVKQADPQVVLNSISVKTSPTKTTYQIGEALDITGLEVVGKYSDNSEKTLNITSSNITGFDSTTAGEKTITVTYEGKTAVFKVTVKEADAQVVLNSIRIVSVPAKITYAPGEALDITGLEVVGKYSDNSEKTLNITSSNITGFDSTTGGEKTITVTYEGKTAQFKVTVTSGEIVISNKDQLIKLANEAISNIEPTIEFKLDGGYKFDSIQNDLSGKLSNAYYNGYESSYNGTTVTMNFKYRTGGNVYRKLVLNKDVSLNANEQDFLNIVNNILAETVVAGDQYQTELNIHDWVINHAVYGDTVDGGQDAYYLLNDNAKGVCNAYADAMHLLLNAAGIKCLKVTGNSANSSGIPVAHAWNKVQLDGDWYILDATWDDPVMTDGSQIVRYKYFNVTSDFVSGDHFEDGSAYYSPECNGTKYNYYVKNNIECANSQAELITALQNKANNMTSINSGDSITIHFYFKVDQTILNDISSKVKEIFESKSGYRGYGIQVTAKDDIVITFK